MKCLIEKCERLSKSRGLCFSCYQTATNLIKDKKTTWEKLEELGLARKRQHIGGNGGVFMEELVNKLSIICEVEKKI
jgi:hypothetical protein